MSNDLTTYYLYALSGIIVVFAGLVIIELVIALFNRFAEKRQKRGTEQPIAAIHPRPEPVANPTEEELVAITSALECYYRIYYERLASQLTFVRTPQQSAWKAGVNYSQRSNAPSNL